MNGTRSVALALLVAVGALPVAGCSDGSTENGGAVRVVRVPDGGLMPQAVIDDAQRVHLVYFRGDARGGDLWHAARGVDEGAWSPPERINSEPGTVTGLGPIDGGQLALGADSRLHVVWLQVRSGRFFYSRTNPRGTGFEPQRVVGVADGVEAAPAVAADRTGSVYAFWHAGEPDDAHRAVFATVSRDGGDTFEPVARVSEIAEGACLCCGLRARADDRGHVYVSYRGAGDNARRGQRLLTSQDGGRTFADRLLDAWELLGCPVSTTSLGQGPAGTIVAWETRGQVHYAAVSGGEAVSPTGVAEHRRKHPAVAVNQRGETLLVWGDGSGVRSGGALRWQIFDAAGQVSAEQAGQAASIPHGSHATALARSDDTFLVIF